MTLGLSTRAVSAPLGTAGAFAPTMPAVKLVPLSVFFLDRAEAGEDDEDAMYGLQSPSKDKEKDAEGRKKGRKKKKRRKPGESRQSGKGSSERDKGGDGREDETVGVGKKQPPSAPARPAAGGPEPPKSESIIEGKISQPQKCKYCDNPATKAYIWAEGRAYIPVCEGHEKTARRRIEKTNRDKVTAVKPIPQRQTTAEQTPLNAPNLTPVKSGATRASSGAMGTGNIPRYHVPLGPPLRRVTPIGDEEEDKKKRKRRKLKGEDRDRWIERMGELTK